MDPVSGAALVITLIDVVIKTFKLIKSLTQSYENAPAEIQDLRHRLEGLTSHLLLLRQVQKIVSTEQNALDLDSIELDHLKRSLDSTRVIFAEIFSFLKIKTSKLGCSARIRWAVCDASKVKAWELRLHRHEELLQTTLLLLNRSEHYRYSSLFEDEFNAAKEALRLQTYQLNTLMSKSGALARFSWARSVFGPDWELPYVARVNGSISCSEGSCHQSYGVSLRLHALFCLKAVCFEMRLKRQSLFSFEISAIGTGVVLKNVIPADSIIMVASQSGNTSVASVNDITPDNFSPLSYAIAGGSLDVLSFLVSKGADTRKTFGRSQTDPLDWALAHRQYAVARWLLENGADVHHISARGWTPLFSLFGAQPCHSGPCGEFLELFSAACFDDFNAQDRDGWTIMHRAAAFGNAEHIKC
ncbi:uncharacterized protein BP5553_01286 [Venustampulla echinocandica]|uniref:Uncharacterized protein n=1 Tax=Venustampulla echinocandica TaxID=2656787 RepID=A0A370U0L0_9HELO|nr:uncharacterized protein BP5553_01286 [Venustampulla echinocandica]RDL41307.1 hypothetical protein BP5553_01286 [Venustampulla echinocandica]